MWFWLERTLLLKLLFTDFEQKHEEEMDCAVRKPRGLFSQMGKSIPEYQKYIYLLSCLDRIHNSF